MLPSIDGNTRCAMEVPEMWSCDMEEEIRVHLEANRDISDAVRDACFRPWSDTFVIDVAYEIPLENARLAGWLLVGC